MSDAEPTVVRDAPARPAGVVAPLRVTAPLAVVAGLVMVAA